MKLKYTKFQKIIELFTIIIILGMWIYLIKSWGSLPNKIPVHYNGAGAADDWDDKSNVLAVPITSSVLYILITILSFFPSIWNTPVAITEENRKSVYLNLRNMIILSKFEMVGIFAYLTYCDIKSQSLGVLFLPIALIVVFGTVIYYAIKACKKNTAQSS